MTYPFITAFVGAALIILQQILMLSTGLHRGKTKIGVGFGDDRDLERKIRRHGNLAENAAIYIVVLGLVEMLVGSTTAVLALGGLFIAARLFHALAFMSLAGSHDPNAGPGVFFFFRAFGAFGTLMSGFGIGLYLVYLLTTAA